MPIIKLTLRFIASKLSKEDFEARLKTSAYKQSGGFALIVKR